MPKLVCDRPTDQVDYYTLVGLPGDPQSPLSENIDYGLEYELNGLSPGTYNLMVSACNTWSCSLTVPFDFTVPEPPSQPIGLDILFI